MNTGFWLCGVLILPLLFIGFLFNHYQERAAKYVAGFNTLSVDEQSAYDRKALAKDMRNRCLLWSLIMGVGAYLCYLISTYMFIPTYLLFFILFFKDVHLDAKKAFAKYRIS